MKGFPMGKKPIRTSCIVIGTILVNIPISLLPTPSRIFPIRWAHCWALKQNLINNTKYESNVKISNRKYRATWKNLLIYQRNLLVNARTAERLLLPSMWAILLFLKFFIVAGKMHKLWNYDMLCYEDENVNKVKGRCINLR